jgi:hypothetical protein
MKKVKTLKKMSIIMTSSSQLLTDKFKIHLHSNLMIEGFNFVDI